MLDEITVYRIINKLNGRAYIGQTNNFLRRISEHSCAKSRTYISKSIKKNGWNNFTVELLHKCKTIEEANNIEAYFIKYFQTLSPDGYNLSSGGRKDFQRTEDVKKRLSGSLTGRVFSKEHRKNISLAKKKLCKERGYVIKDRKYTQSSLDKNISHQPTIKHVLCIETGIIYQSLREAAKSTGINRESISLASQGKNDREGYLRKTAGGYKWKVL